MLENLDFTQNRLCSSSFLKRTHQRKKNRPNHNFYQNDQTLGKMLFFTLLVALFVVFSSATKILEADHNVMAVSHSMIEQINVSS
jgi:hypothetical protein